MDTNRIHMSHKFPNDPIRDFETMLWNIFPEYRGKYKMVRIPCGDVPYDVLEWNVGPCAFRYLISNNGHSLSIRLKSGKFWIMSQSEDSKLYELNDQEFDWINDYIKSDTGEAPSNVFYVFSSNGSKTYEVKIDPDPSHVSCQCPGFKHQGYNKQVDKKCRHLTEIYSTYPDLLPDSIRVQDEIKPVTDSVGLPIDLYNWDISAIRDTLATFNDIDKYEMCGDYRRLSPVIKSVDIVVLMKGQSPFSKILDYFENILRFERTNDWPRTENMGSFIVSNMCKFNFIAVPAEKYATTVLHLTGGKILDNMHYIANTKNMTLTKDGLFDMYGRMIPCFNEMDVFEKLDMTYVEPWKR